MNILIIGSGGREHALAWKIKQSDHCNQLFVMPGNAGTAAVANNINIDINAFDKVEEFVTSNQIELVVVGPEDPLVNGITDYFKSTSTLSEVKIIGPDKKGAQLEGSKDFAKQFMVKNQIPTAKSRTFDGDQLDHGKSYIDTLEAPIVLKADGLAAGKGVIISDDKQEAKKVLEEMLIGRKFGNASNKVVIEEFLSGIELSTFVLTDGNDYVILPEAKDYKRIGIGDTGPNTGGMGAISPVKFADKAFLQKVEDRIVKPTINGLKKDGIDYCGFIFIGLMNVNGDPYVIEYNVRMGDPETQVVMPRIKNDLVELLLASTDKNLGKVQIDITDQVASTVVMVSGGYPGTYEKGKLISGLNRNKEALVFHAGTKVDEENNLVTNGGRVLAITGLGPDLAKAREISYNGIQNIYWNDVYFRKDIGNDLISYE